MSDRPRLDLTVEAPCRADLAGGTLDIWPLGVLHPGSVTVNAAIPVMVKLELDLGAPEGEVWHAIDGGPWRVMGPVQAAADLTAAVVFALRPAAGVRVVVRAQAAVGSGLGGSSAYAVALAKAVCELASETIGDERLVVLARDLEARVLGVPTGVQDHWPAIRGGVLALHLEPGGERLEQLDVDAAWVGRRMTVFDTGIAHHSGMVNWQVIRRRLDGDAATSAALDAIAGAARDCRRCLLAGDERGVGEAVAREWAARRRLAPEVCPSELGRLEATAAAVGAWGFKACGAGGGGSVLLWHGADDREAIVEALTAAAPAGRVVATGIARGGSKISRHL